mgnify:CR=1 FL=1
MKFIKSAILTFALFFCISSTYAQDIELDTIPPELIGSWIVTNVYAVDTAWNNDSSETAALMADLVEDNEVIYEFSMNTFTLKINGEIVGVCGYVLDIESNFIFDEDGLAFQEIVKDLVGINLTTTELRLEASPPDGESQLTYHEFLTKLP